MYEGKELPGVSDLTATIAPGLVGGIARWMTSTAVKPQPALSCAAALALVGSLKAHRVKTSTGLRTNLLLANIAPSGSGKNHPIVCCKKLLDAVQADSLLMAEPASNAGLAHELKKKSGRGFLIWDEFGLALKQMADARAAGHQKEILTLITKLFSCADSSYLGTAYSEGSKRDVIPLEQPHLSVLGASTPKALYGSLNGNLVENGFVARFLFIAPQGAGQVARQDPEPMAIPQNIIDGMRLVLGWQTSGPENGNIAQWLVPDPCEVLLGPEPDSCSECLTQIREYFDEMVGSTENDDAKAIWNRGEEHVMKVALTVADGLYISPEELAWSFQFVREALTTIIYHIDASMGDTQWERQTKRVLEVIREAQGLSRSELTRKTQFLKAKERDEILETLHSMNTIGFEFVGSKRNPVQIITYRDRA